MPLKKTNAELTMTKGIEQKISDYVIPDESLAVAENVDFSKVGAAKKRAGFVTNSNLVLGAGALDPVRRLGARQRREVLCITETVTQIGSSAGVGTAGDTLFAYSEEAEKWVVRGKMPRANVDVLWTSGVTSTSDSVPTDFVTGGVDNYVCVAHLVNADGIWSVRVVVFDAGGDIDRSLRESPTLVIDTTFSSPAGGTGSLIGWAQAGGVVWLVYAGNTTFPQGTWARAFRPDTVTFDSFETVVDSVSAKGLSTDGTGIFIAFHTGGGFKLTKFDSGMVATATTTNNSLAIAQQEIALDARLDNLDLVRRDRTDGRTYVSRYSKSALTLFVSNSAVTVASATEGYSNLVIASVSDTTALVVMANQFSLISTAQPTYMLTLLVNMSAGTLLGSFGSSSLIPYAPPFIIDGRVYLVAMHSTGYVQISPGTVTGTQLGEESFLCLQIPIDTLNGNTLPMPAAQWDYGQCIAKTDLVGSMTGGTFWMFGRTHYQSGTSLYVMTNIAATAGQSALDALPVPRLVRLEMGDATHRWRHEEFHDYAAFAGGVPFVYDGNRTSELGIMHCPTIHVYALVTGGALVDTKTYFFQAAMLYVDGNGRECWSQPSRIVEVTAATPDLAVALAVMPVTFSMKADSGNGSMGRMRLYLFMATQEAKNEFRVAAPPQEVWPSSIEPIWFSVAAETSPTNDLMYTSGFELDNYPPPPCRAVTVHSGRFYAISSDSNELWYTKPFRRDRAPEFALGQSVPLPDKGTALASLNDRLAIFTHRSILALGGDGPDVTGTPPDAFSRPVLVSPDYGCVEYCAVGRTPLGVIFRGQQGFYLLGMGFDVQYIGASVEDITAGWQSTRSIVHDQKSACCRITGFTGDRSEELCFWYDTKRWSLNVLGTDVIDSIALGDNVLVAVDDTTVAVASRYRLGGRAAVEYQDFGDSYDQTLETGWLSFQNAGVFKRIWRVYVLARSAGAACTLRVQVWKDWESDPSSDREFSLSSLDTEPRNLRIHLKHQKLKAVKVRVTVTSDGQGADIMKIGFELGMRTGGPKEVREQSQ